MLFIIFSIQLIVIFLAATVVGLAIVKLLPYRLRPIARLYFSPLFGVAAFALVAIFNGWIAPYNQLVSLFELLFLVGISFFFIRKEIKWASLSRYSLFLIFFSLISTAALSLILIRYNAYNPFDDTFTYLVHGQWMQKHAFFQSISASGFRPALSQITLYQNIGSRMGGSFFLGWMQSVFGLKWSYAVYPAAIAIPFAAGTLAIGGAINLVVKGSRKIAILTSVAAATMFSGLTFGFTNGFYPQTFGIAFSVGGLSLFAALINESRRIKHFRTYFINIFPVSLLFAALAHVYSDMVSFIVVGMFVYLILTLVFDRTNIKGILLSYGVLIIQSLLLINIELFRFFSYAKTLVSLATSKMVGGYPISFKPFEFLGFSFGFKTAYADYWIFGQNLIGPSVFIVIFIATLVFVFIHFRKKLVNPLLIHSSFLLLVLAGIIYFRYFKESVFPNANDVGLSFLQFKLSKWASPFSYVVMGSAIAFYSKKFRTNFLAVFLAFLILFSSYAHYTISSKNLMQGFIGETGYERSGYSVFLTLSEKIDKLNPNDIIYLNLPNHSKLRQIVAYFLIDTKLASDYRDDGYIVGQLPRDQQNMSFDIADWVIEFAKPGEAKKNNGTGNLILKKASEVQDFYQNAVTGGYDREVDRSNWQYWSSKALNFKYSSLSKTKKRNIFLKFTYLPTTAGRTLTIKVANKTIQQFVMNTGWNEFKTEPFDFNDESLSIDFISDGKPVRASENDSRMVSFLIKNLELLDSK